MTPIFSGIGAASVRGFGRIFKGPGQFIWDTQVLLSTTGAGNWTKPADITQVQIECWGAGGRGGDSAVNGAGGGGGGGGGYARSIITYPSASQSIPYVVGASGSATTWNNSQIIAQGGFQGESALSTTQRAQGGIGGGVDLNFLNIGDVTYIGGDGNPGWSLNVASSGIEFSSGGGAAGSTGDGGNANINVGPGTGTADFGGDGAIGTQGSVNFTGLNGTIYGGGGSGGQKVSGGQTRLGGLGAQGLIRVRYSAAPTPEYWWRADSGLSTTAWNASAGGLNFTLFNVTSANSTTGLTFNNENSTYGVTSGAPSDIDVKHIFIRSDNIVGNADQAILGSTQDIIQEWYYTNVVNDWYIVERLSGGSLQYAAQNGALGSSITWTDLGNFAQPTYYLNADNTGTSMTVYAGTYTNRLRWEAGAGIYLGRRGQGSFLVSGNIKEIALFTTNLTTQQAQNFRESMATRWP